MYRMFRLTTIINQQFIIVIVWVVVNNPVTHGFIFRAEGTGFKYEPVCVTGYSTPI